MSFQANNHHYQDDSSTKLYSKVETRSGEIKDVRKWHLESSERLQNAGCKMRRQGKVSEQDVKEMMREVRVAVARSRCYFKLVKVFENCYGERLLSASIEAFTKSTIKKIFE